MNPKRTLLLLCLSLCFMATAQSSKYSDKYLQRKPVWIELIKQENVNYFEAMRAFELYWQNRDKPVEEEEVLGGKFAQTREKRAEKKETGWVRRRIREREEEAEKLAFEHKRFLDWERKVHPYVQPDGRILTMEERLKIWESEKQRPQAK